MARCWTCGSPVGGWSYACSSCKGLNELKDLRGQVESFHGDVSTQLDYMAEVQREGFIALRNTLSEGFSKVASAIEWGFGEISWQLQQQTEVLRSIDQTLKTPSETQANERRQMAEKLRSRGVLDQSEEFYLKALELNPLDYRIYVGLAKTCLESNKFDKAKTFLEKSLPHAPKKKEIDYRSYSYRLIGHICACEEDYSQAMSILQPAIELSPDYADGHYDYAQYCAQMRNTELCLSSLRKAISAKSLYWYLAQKERNFEPVRVDVENLLSRISEEAARRVKDVIDQLENTLVAADRAISEAKEVLVISRDKAELRSITIYKNAEAKLKLAKDKVASGDYVAFLDAKPIADEAHTLADNAKNKAEEEQERSKKRRKEKVKNAWKTAPGIIVGWSIILAIVCCILGGFLGMMVGSIAEEAGAPFDEETFLVLGFQLGAVVGLVFGLIVGIYFIWKELQ